MYTQNSNKETRERAKNNKYKKQHGGKKEFLVSQGKNFKEKKF
jgi:hypothetical protein